MIISMNRQTLPKAVKTISDYELQRMSESNFRASGWKTYAESPYAIYHKQTKDLVKKDK